MGGGFNKPYVGRQTSAVIDPKDKVYTWDCYKWIVDRTTKGEVWACYDKRTEQSNSQSLIFVLWWLKGGESGYNTFTEIEQIKLEEDNKTLSFVFTSGQEKYGERKLKNPRGLYWRKKSGSSSELERQPQLDWNKISGKNLKGQCKLQGDDLICESYQQFKAAQERIQASPRFKLIY